MAEGLIPFSYPMIQRGGSLIAKGSEVIPRVTSAASGMRNVTPAMQAIPKLGMAASTGAGGGALKKMGGRLLVAKTAYDLANLALSEQARREAEQEVEDSAENDGALVRAGKGFLNPVNTAFGIGSMIGDLMDSTAAAERSAASLARGREQPTPEMSAKRKKVQEDIAANKAKKEYESRRQAALAIEAAAADAEANRKMSFQDSVEQRLANPSSATQPRVMTAEEALATPKSIFGQPNTKFESYDSLSDMVEAPISPEMIGEEQAPAMPAMGGEEQPPKAKPVYDQKLLNELFKVATHSTFYGKNKGDVAMMGNIENLLEEYGGQLPKGMTPTQFALQLYRRL